MQTKKKYNEYTIQCRDRDGCYHPVQIKYHCNLESILVSMTNDATGRKSRTASRWQGRMIVKVVDDPRCREVQSPLP